MADFGAFWKWFEAQYGSRLKDLWFAKWQQTPGLFRVALPPEMQLQFDFWEQNIKPLTELSQEDEFKLEVADFLEAELEAGRISQKAFDIQLDEAYAEIDEQGVHPGLKISKQIETSRKAEEKRRKEEVDFLKSQADVAEKEGRRQEAADLRGQAQIGEKQAALEQERRLGEFEQDRAVEAEFAEPTGEPARFLSAEEKASALAKNAALVRQQFERDSGSISIAEVPGDAGDKLRSVLRSAQALGMNVSNILSIRIGIKQSKTGEGEQMIGQRIIALTNAIQRRQQVTEQQESELLTGDLPEAVGRFKKFRGEIVDPGRSKFAGLTQFVEDQPDLQSRLTDIRARRRTRFPDLTTAFRQAPFEERQKGFGKFITATPEARSLLERRTRPRRTRGVGFRPFKRR